MPPVCMGNPRNGSISKSRTPIDKIVIRCGFHATLDFNITHNTFLVLNPELMVCPMITDRLLHQLVEDQVGMFLLNPQSGRAEP